MCNVHNCIVSAYVYVGICVYVPVYIYVSVMKQQLHKCVWVAVLGVKWLECQPAGNCKVPGLMPSYCCFLEQVILLTLLQSTYPAVLMGAWCSMSLIMARWDLGCSHVQLHPWDIMVQPAAGYQPCFQEDLPAMTPSTWVVQCATGQAWLCPQHGTAKWPCLVSRVSMCICVTVYIKFVTDISMSLQ